MTGVQAANKGQVEAHMAATAEQAVAAAIEQALTPEPELPGLADDTTDVLGRVAETINAERRARGRPPGATNKRNDEVFDYLEARGFKAPELRLMELVSADVVALTKALSGREIVSFEEVLEVVKLQVKAAGELLPYKLARKPQGFEINRKTMHVFMAGPLSAAGKLAEHGLSLTNGAEEYQGVSMVEDATLVQASLVQPSHGQQDQGVEVSKPAP